MRMSFLFDENILENIEREAVHMAWGAGAILARYFGKTMDVEYKQKGDRDPVTMADKESEAYLKESIKSRFPDHGILSEEDTDGQEYALPDTVWVLDPLDGTTNFLNGLPLYAVSIAVLHLGIPVVGALFIPWPVSSNGFVMHARRGGGAFINEDSLSVNLKQPGPLGNRLTALPGSFGSMYRFGKGMQGKVGEVRVTGSIAYELALVVKGVVQYAFISAPHLWDVAAGTLVTTEAGGAVFRRGKQSKDWNESKVLVEGWGRSCSSYEALRKWTASMIFGNCESVQFVADHLETRAPSLDSVVKGMVRRVMRRKDA